MNPEEPTEKRQRLRQYRNRWGHVRQFDVPKWLINNELLSTPIKRTLVGLYFSQSEQPKLNTTGLPAIASVSIERLCDLTDLSEGTVSKSIRQLKAYGYIRQHLTVQKKGVSAGFAPAVYTFSSPTRLKLIEHVTLTVTEGKRLLLGNNIDYVTVPRIVLADTSAQYSLAKMTDPEFLVYFACLSTATRANVFTMTTADLIELTKLTMPTIERALCGLRSRGLMNGKVITRATKETAGELLIEILDPASGKPIPPPMDDPEPEPGSYAKRPILKPAEVERLLRERIPPGRYLITSTANMNSSCPDHLDLTPSL